MSYDSQKLSKVIFIVGPTASGKSDLAVKLAKKFDGEIISADSRQVYKGLDIGSGKIKKKEMGDIQHYLLDVASPKKNFSLGRYLKLAYVAADKIIYKNAISRKKGALRLAQGKFRQRKIPIFVGGTWLYFKAIKDGWIIPDVKPNQKLRAKLEKKTAVELFMLLKKIDPRRAADIDRYNPRRLIRAIEIARAIKKVPQLKQRPRYDILPIGIKFPIKKLEERIRLRLQKRIPGILKEIKKLRKEIPWERLIGFGLEYDWFSKYLRGSITFDEATEKCFIEIKRFAKRQIRTFDRENVFWVSGFSGAEKIIKKWLAARN